MTDKTTTTEAGKWMPEEYTREMYTAFWDAEAGQGCIRFADAYRAMLRAAPSPAPAAPSAAQIDVGPNVAVQDVAEQVERRVNERGGEAAVDDIVALTIEVLWEMQRAALRSGEGR